MLKLFFWLKYLRTRRILILSIAAVAVSVSLLIVVASLFSGVIDTYQKVGKAVLGDVIVVARDGSTLDQYPEFIERLKRCPTVDTATPTLRQEGLLFIRKGDVRPVSIWGIQPQSRAEATEFRQSLVLEKDAPGPLSWKVPDSSSTDGGYVGIGLLADPNSRTDEYDTSAILKKNIGQNVVAITAAMPKEGDTENLPKQKNIAFHVADLVYTGFYEADSQYVFVPIERLQQALYPDSNVPRATMIHIKLKPDADVNTALTEVRDTWNTFVSERPGWNHFFPVVETAEQMQRDYVVELRKQMSVLLVIFGVVSFSVVVLVFCIFYMIVRLKRRDIAIMKSCGTTGLSVIWLFLGFGVTIGLVGASLGAVLGYVITKNINVIENWISVVFGLKLWSGSVYMFTRIPNEVDWVRALPIVAMAVAAAALGALLPAFIAARTRPVEVLRYE